ncbi:hypothetical protein F3Y22_tig00110162pilonHSYRG00129 [Hibiscus syriacus]|uniref:C2 domain-containing protein n=1 Tax=Hibiscus syriacus TaxID=106335 RepID=A0A6A3BKQ1_HIBSY|nr:elicitor-responsive protein 1-like [Hibiscus syriacus]KAE8715662.1 hypothetical protein F3Y22_tig00110162pilonHSYRG00129 [Hibiscus syriacus]
MSISGIHGLTLEVTVVGCYNLQDKEWVSRQDPYVCLDYGSAKYRTKTCTDGGRNPTFQEKFIFTLIEGLRELNVGVWNSNTLVADDFIGSGRIQLHTVLSQGFEDCTWPLQSKTGRHSGEVRLIMYYPNARQPQNWMTKGAPSFPGYAPSAPLAQVTPYAHPPAAPYPTPMPYAALGLSSYNSYPPTTTTTYPPSPYAGYPPASYTYPPQVYPPPPQPSPCYPPAPAGIYPPPPY